MNIQIVKKANDRANEYSLAMQKSQSQKTVYKVNGGKSVSKKVCPKSVSKKWVPKTTTPYNLFFFP